jgi:hypothetical protein
MRGKRIQTPIAPGLRASLSHRTITPIRRRQEGAMPNLWSTVLLMVILCVSAAIGFFVHSRLPEQHRSAQSIGLVQLVIGLLVTFIAIVLGLLTTSVKAGFDTAYSARGHYAGELAQMDRCLRDYGPETAPVREQLRAYVAAVIASTWPNEPPPANVSYPDASKMARTGENPVLASLMNDVGLKTRSLQPTDPVHESVMAACVQDYHDLIQARWAVIEGLRQSISTPFYWVLVFWLAILFGSFGLTAAPNPMIATVIALCALSISAAVLVIKDLDEPYGGLFGISSTSMRDALADMTR